MTKILIFGAGSAMHDLLCILPVHVEVLGILDNDPLKHGTIILGHQVHAPDIISQFSFDFVVVAAQNSKIILSQLLSMGLDRNRILIYPGIDESLRETINENIDAINRYLGIGLHRVSLCTMKYRLLPLSDVSSCEIDFCRKMSLYLAAERIVKKGIPGAIAEVGVYRGEFASDLNRLFPNRMLYLFDTFEGFSTNDLHVERERQFSIAKQRAFMDTNVDFVMSRMIHPDKVVVYKGYFPNTVENLEENFAFVSLDVDLYKPTLSGLQFFYPLLSPGGTIFIHDYNSCQYKGVKVAVDEYCEATGIPIVLLPDFCGTAVLSK